MVARSWSSQTRTLGFVAAVIAALCAAGLGLLTASNQEPGLPAEVPWPIILTALLATPALIGGIGAVSGRRTLLAAAGIMCLGEAILAFSGVTLVLLVPGLVFLRAAVATQPRPHQAPAVEAPEHLLRWIALVALAVPVVLLVVLNVGVLGTVGFVALAIVAATLGRRGGVSVRPKDALIGIAVVGLVLGALFAAFANTQTICWNARSTPSGIVYERIPAQESGVISADSGIVSSGCAGGQPTIEGAALTGILLIGAIAIAVQAARGAERQPT